ncbi:MAG: hypothetical protein DRQ10_01860, partial [Candidatus Hydrothermota bacterium]
MKKLIFVLGVLVVVGSLWAWPAASIDKDGGIRPESIDASKVSGWTLIGAIPDWRIVAGSGKNIAVYNGDVAIIWADTVDAGGDYTFGHLRVTYIIDGEIYGSYELTTYPMRRYYPSVTYDPITGYIWFAWQEAPPGYPNSVIKVATDIAYPDGTFETALLDTSLDNNTWLPTIVAYGDTLVVLAQDIGFGSVAGGIFYWISYDGGITWSSQKLLGIYDDVPLVKYVPGGRLALVAQHSVGDNYTEVPVFIDAHLDGDSIVVDYEVDLFEASGGFPLPSMAGWWWGYDFVLDNENRPHIVWRSGDGFFSGDVFYFTPLSGEPGNWSDWQVQVLVGTGTGAAQADFSYIAYDPNMDVLVVTYAKPFGDQIDVGYGTIIDGEWYDMGPISTVDDVIEYGVHCADLIYNGNIYLIAAYNGEYVTYFSTGIGPSLNLVDYTVVDPSGGTVDPGEEARITVTLENTSPFDAHNVTGYLYVDDPFVTAVDTEYYFGEIASGATVTNSEPYVLQIDPGTPVGYPVTAYLHLVGDNVDKEVAISFFVTEERYLTYDLQSGDVTFAVVANGYLGHSGGAGGSGGGFQLAGADWLYQGWFAVSNTPSDVAYGDEWNAPLVPEVGLLKLLPKNTQPTYGDVQLRGIIQNGDYNLSSEILGYCFNDPGDAGYFNIVFVKYRITNNGSNPLNDLYFGWYMDLDIYNYALNGGGIDEDHRLVYMDYDDSDYSGYLGVMVPDTSLNIANLSIIDNPTYVYPGFSDSIQYSFLSGSLHFPTPDSLTDLSLIASVGPYTINPGDTFEVV